MLDQVGILSLKTMVFLLSKDRDPKSWAVSAHDLCSLINLEQLVVESSNFGLGNLVTNKTPKEGLDQV